MNEKFDSNFIDDVLRFLKVVSGDGEVLASLSEIQRISHFKISAKISHQNINEIKKRNRAVRRTKEKNLNQIDRKVRATTGIREARVSPVFVAPKQIAHAVEPDSPRFTISPRNCYVCKALFNQIHFFYDSMCPDCADFNY